MEMNSKFFCTAVFTIIVIVLISDSRACDSYNFNSVGLDTVSDDDAETNSTVHVPSWSGRLSRRAQNFTTLTVEWDAPTSPVVLCAYTVHYYPAKAVDDITSHVSVHLSPNKTDVTLTNLNIGTKYHIYVEAIFDKPLTDTLDRLQVLKSWLLGTSTLGYGSEDNPCNCDTKGTENNDADNCDSLSGQCRCKSVPLTSGRRCETCADNAYMNDELGCAVCDQCDSLGSYGTCKPAPGGKMNCDCKEGFVEPHCRDCDNGYYPVGDHCVACNCSGNEKKMKEFNWCSRNGTCIYCDYHTTGDHCEQCYPGYTGDALLRTCRPLSATGHKIGIAILLIIIVVLLLAVVLFTARRLIRRRRRDQFKQSGRDSGVNFTTLEQEPDVGFSHGDRKLQFMGATASS